MAEERKAQLLQELDELWRYVDEREKNRKKNEAATSSPQRLTDGEEKSKEVVKEKDDEAEEHIPDQYKPEPTGENVTGGDDAIENGEKQKRSEFEEEKLH